MTLFTALVKKFVFILFLFLLCGCVNLGEDEEDIEIIRNVESVIAKTSEDNIKAEQESDEEAAIKADSLNNISSIEQESDEEVARKADIINNMKSS